MSTTIKQEVRDPAGAPSAEGETARIGKSSVERNRRWVHATVWGIALLIVLTTGPSFHATGARVILALLSWALVTAGTVGRLWCGLYLFGRKSKEVQQDGPYSVCRNPLYVSAFLSILGVAIATNRMLVMILLPLVMGIEYLLVIDAEERRLRVLFGQEYEAYYARTPRIVPRFNSYRSPDALVLDPDHYLRGIVKAMGYFWALLGLLLIEAL